MRFRERKIARPTPAPLGGQVRTGIDTEPSEAQLIANLPPMDDAQEKPNLLTRLQLKLAASRFFTFSLLLHVVIVIMAGSVVIFKRFADPPDFAAEGGGGLVQDEAAAEPPAAQPETPQQTFTPTQPTVSAPSVDVIATTATTPTSFQMQTVQPTMKAPASADMNKELAKAVQASAGRGMGNLPATMAGRAGGSARNMAMQKMGGKDKSEKAVLAGLRWLKKNQNPDGSWSDPTPGPYRAAMTGLSILCFLGHGETPESPEFGPTVKKGVDWFLTNGIKNQGKLSLETNFSGPGVYAHAIGAYALGEYYTMTKDDRVKDVLTQAVAYIVDGQTADGGWLYSYNKGPDSDTSVTGWQIQALKAAHLTGLNLPGVDESLDKAMLDFKRVQGPNGGFGYHTPEDRYSLAGVGVLCTYFWKGDKDKLVRDGIKFILDKTEKDYPVEYKGSRANLYAWYYNTQACLMFGGNAWTKWNRWFQDQIADNQSPDGSWPPPGAAKMVGPQQDVGGAGPYYRTTLCVLMLEVFYRYMPSNK